MRHCTSPVASFGMFTTSLGEFGLYFTAAVESFGKAGVAGSQQSPHTPEQAWGGVFPQTEMFDIWFEIALVICKADFLSRCQLGMFVWGIALQSDFLVQCLGYRKCF